VKAKWKGRSHKTTATLPILYFDCSSLGDMCHCIISLIDRLRMYILRTVRSSLLNVIRMIRLTLPVVPNIMRTACAGTYTRSK
jgi:hypothetical protein